MTPRSRLHCIILLLLFSSCIPVTLRSSSFILADSAHSNYAAVVNEGFTIGARYCFLATINNGPMTDYAANGIAIGLQYKSPVWNGLRFGASGYFLTNLGSSDLAAPDPIAKLPDRYELRLFDNSRPDKTYALSRWEELYLEYGAKQLLVRLGSMKLQLPYINPQDGALRPGMEQALMAEWRPANEFSVVGGWIFGFAPRSTVGWYTVAQTIGLYPAGTSTIGKKSGYIGNQTTAGIGFLWAKYAESGFKAQFYEQYTENIFNTAMVQAEYEPEKSNNVQPVVGVQVHMQNKIANGGNDDPLLAYYEGQERASAISCRIGVVSHQTAVNLNFTRISADGRFLMPREWGRDAFYTFLPRERNEGLGDAKAFTAQFEHKWPVERYTLMLGAGYYALPDVKNTRLNKYGMESYCQFNIDARKTFVADAHTIELQILLMGKVGVGEVYGNPAYRFNKTDMLHLYIAVNYQFKSMLGK